MAVLVLAAYATLSLAAQEAPATVSGVEPPDAPGIEAPIGGAGSQPTAQHGSATISGTVLDTNGAEIQGAQVVLSTLPGGSERVLKSDDNGEFSFAGLPPGKFKLTVTGPGWGTYVSPEIELQAGSVHLVPNIVLPVAATSTVTVTANRERLSVQQAEEQLHIEERQRVLGVIPNFYTTFDWNAPPLDTKQKFQLVFKSLSDPITFVGAGSVAGIEQAGDAFPGFGQGVEGYSKRFGAAYADDFVAGMLGEAVLPSLFHQDPRYFYKGKGSFGSRVNYALSAAVMTRSDSGRWEPNYSFILGSFASGGISNLYYPSESRGASLVLENGLIDIAAQGGTNLLREFILKRFTTKQAKGADVQP